MHPEVALLAEHLASVLENISQDVRSISLSVKEVNHSVLKMAKKKCPITVSTVGRRDASNRETSEREAERLPDFHHVLERLVVAAEGLPHEVKNISLSLKNINANICLMRSEGSVSQYVSSWVDESSNEEEIPMERAEPSLIRKEKNIGSGMASLSASTHGEIEYPSAETDSSQNSVHEAEDYMESSHTTYASELDIQSSNTRKIALSVKKSKNTSTNVSLLYIMKPLPAAQPTTELVEEFEVGRLEECSVSDSEEGGSDLRIVEDTTVGGDYMSSSGMVNLQQLGEYNAAEAGEGTPGVTEQNARLEEKASLKKKRPPHDQNFDQRDLPSHCKKTLKCPVCMREFMQKSRLFSHMEVHRSEGIQELIEIRSEPVPDVSPVVCTPFPCWQCDFSFPTLTALKHHHESSDCGKALSANDSDEKPFLCEHCGNGFKTTTALAIHVRKHTGEKPYVCEVCNESFSQKCSLVWHTRRHTGERPYACDLCEKNYRRKSALSRHKLTHTAERPFPCSTCGSAFPTKYELKRHNFNHTGYRPFACTECGCRFKHKAHLNTHYRLKHKHHVAPLPYSCDVCDKSFAESAARDSHMRSHIEKLYRCGECGEAFKSIGALNHHRRTTHASEWS